MFGEEREYLTIKILHNDMTVMVPCENAGVAGCAASSTRRPSRRSSPSSPTTSPRCRRTGIAVQAQPRQDQDGRHLRARRGRAQPRDPRAREGPVDRREADVHAGEEDPRVRADVRARQGRGRGRAAPRRPPRRQRWSRGASSTRARRSCGKGERLGSGGPKAFVVVAGRPMLEWSIEALRARPGVEQIVVALPAGGRGAAGHDRRHRRRAALALGARRAARRRRRPGHRPRRRAPARDAADLRAALDALAEHGCDAVDRGRAGDRHDQGGRRRRRRAHARPLDAVGGADAAGLPPRGAGARAVGPTTCSRPRPTTPGSSSAPAAACGSWRRRART